MVNQRSHSHPHPRMRTRQVMAGEVAIGGGAPISVQSMTNVPTMDTEAVRKQISLLASRGAELVRVAVPDAESASALPGILEDTPVPLVADIHFDPELALTALRSGIHKLRLNPGNIRRPKDLLRIAEEAASRGIPIRIGVNSGSVPGDLREQYSGVNSNSMWAAARRHIAIIEETGFHDLVLSLKASDPMLTVDVNRLASRECDYPLHIGVTEAGPPFTGGIRSAVALTILLSEGIGDTIRVSLSGAPETEPTAAWEILSSLNIRKRFPRIISCPTCARCRLDVGGVAFAVQAHLAGIEGDYTIAVMGCEVNGPGEAKEADIALIGTPSGLMLFVDGENTGEVDRSEMTEALDSAIDSYRRRKP